MSVPKSHSAVDESLWRGCPKTRISKVTRFFPCCHGQTMLIFGSHWLPYRAAPQNVRALEQVVFCTFGDCQINKLCFFIFLPVLDLCQVFRNLPNESYSRVRASILRDSPKICRDESANQQMVTSKNSKIVHGNVVQKCHGIHTWLQFVWGDRTFFGTCHTVEIARFFLYKNVRALLLKKSPNFARRNPIPW